MVALDQGLAAPTAVKDPGAPHAVKTPGLPLAHAVPEGLDIIVKALLPAPGYLQRRGRRRQSHASSDLPKLARGKRGPEIDESKAPAVLHRRPGARTPADPGRYVHKIVLPLESNGVHPLRQAVDVVPGRQALDNHCGLVGIVDLDTVHFGLGSCCAHRVHVVCGRRGGRGCCVHQADQVHQLGVVHLGQSQDGRPPRPGSAMGLLGLNLLSQFFKHTALFGLHGLKLQPRWASAGLERTLHGSWALFASDQIRNPRSLKT
mmetsp:Transcript_48529/g.110190  ORF Transcript_48529/g.110190 Transcript_48529/m.110190 type:complete len:261 (+) Transcript_48529:156-938(+)